MATGSNDGEGKFKPRFPGDRATAPTPLEDGSEDTWQEFVRLQSVPASLASIAESSAPPPAAPLSGPVTLENTMALARRADRACPRPAHWQRLHALLPPRAGARAPGPVREQDWPRVSPMQKRLLLRDHIEWAAATGTLPEVHALLAGLAEGDWDHF